MSCFISHIQYSYCAFESKPLIKNKTLKTLDVTHTQRGATSHIATCIIDNRLGTTNINERNGKGQQMILNSIQNEAGPSRHYRL